MKKISIKVKMLVFMILLDKYFSILNYIFLQIYLFIIIYREV